MPETETIISKVSKEKIGLGHAEARPTEVILGEKARKSGSWPTLVFSYLIWQIAALLAVEALLAVAGLGEEELFHLDKQLGTMHMTNKSITWRKEGYAHSYLNADGMREPGLTIAKKPGVYRIALLGDSQIEAIQVPLEKSWGKLLEKNLTEKLHRPVEVLNFGVSGYSTVQEYLLMKRQVFKYQPDLVIMGYDGRDMFENWASADASLSNLRPYALKLPGRPLTIDNSSVLAWNKSPRGKFLNSIEWLRAHSRIWGLFSSFETEASANNKFYKGLILFFTEPVKTMKQFSKDASQPQYWLGLGGDLVQAVKPSFEIKFFDNEKAPADSANKTEAKNKGPVQTGGESSQKQDKAEVKTQAAEKTQAARSQNTAAETSSEQSGSATFLKVLKDTMQALLAEMNKECAAHHAKFMVVGMPSRAVLSPIMGMDAPTFGVDCRGELDLVKTYCAEDGIPYLDALAPAMPLNKDEQAKLFHTAHLSPAGQKYLADTILETVAAQVK